MTCLDPHQLALYVSSWGLSIEERRRCEEHVSECGRCRREVDRVRRDIGGEACARMRERLVSHALGKASNEESAAVRAHEKDCPSCAELLTRLAVSYDADEVSRWAIPVPPGLRSRIEARLDRVWGAVTARERGGALLDGLEGLVTEVRLLLAPLTPAPAFRGEEDLPKSEYVAVQHGGGDFVVSVGAAGVTVELYSSREKYLDDGESDASGTVRFPAMEAGLYKVRVQGHQAAVDGPGQS